MNLDIIDIAIGLALLYLLLCLMLVAIREGLEGFGKKKSVDLERGICELLNYPGLVQEFYNHPFVSALYRGTYIPGSKELPSYIPSRNFALAMMDLAGMSAAGIKATTWALDDLKTASSNWVYKDFQPVLRLALQCGGDDLNAVQAEIETWYDSAMQRVSGWYKRRTQRILLIVGLILTVALNVNTLAIIQALKETSALRDIAVSAAESRVKQASGVGTDQGQPSNALDIYSDVKRLDLPIGWDAASWAVINGWFTSQRAPVPAQAPGGSHPCVASSCTANQVAKTATAPSLGLATLQMIVGWLMTAIALTLGAPFWFDVLSKLVPLAGSLKPADKSSDKASSAFK